MSRKLTTLLAFLLVFSLLATACDTESQSGTQTATSGEKVYRFSDTYDVKSLNAHNDVDTLIGDILAFTHSGLFRMVPAENEVAAVFVGDIAAGEPYQVDDEGYVWRIDLRKDAVWHNGDPINADTFVYSYKMLIDPLLVNSMANFFYDREIKILNGYEYYTQGQEGNPAVDWEDVGFKKIDDYTLEITTTQKYRAADIMRHFNDRSLFPVYEPLYEAGMNASRTVTTYGSSLDNYMGCGPYFFERWTPEADRVYVKNNDHWLSDYFKIERVEARITPDRNARVQMWENGEIDIMGLDSVTLETYRDDPRTRMYPSLTPSHIDINSLKTSNPILTTMNFRRALYWAMDRETIAGLVGCIPSPYYINNQAGAYPEQGITYRMTEEAQALVPENNGFDPVLAKEYFDAALEEIGETKVTVELMYSDTSVGYKAIGEFLQQSLPKIFGEDKFTLTLRAVPSANYSALKNHKQDPNSFELAFGGWGASLSRVYPYAAFQYFVDAYASRPNSFISEDFDKLFAECQAEEVRLNPELMVQMTAELEAIYLRDVVNVPLYQSVGYTMYSERMVLPFDEYIPAFGFGTMFADIIVE